MSNTGLRTYKEAVVLITGGASGIGRGLGEELARQGAVVILADRQTELAEDVARQIEANGGNATALALDVTEAAAVKSVVESVFEEYGRLDYLFNNAGIVISGETELNQLSDWYLVLDVNLRGVVHGVHAAYPIMLKQGFGHIVNTASIAGLLPGANMISYYTTKFAVVGLSTSLRVEAARHGVRVSVICPGAIDTAIVGGGKYGKMLRPVPKELMDEMWQQARPMKVDLFARRVAHDVARNKSIIVQPWWWRIFWWLYRLSPSLGLWVLQRQFRASIQKMEAYVKEHDAQRAAEEQPATSRET